MTPTEKENTTLQMIGVPTTIVERMEEKTGIWNLLMLLRTTKQELQQLGMHRDEIATISQCLEREGLPLYGYRLKLYQCAVTELEDMSARTDVAEIVSDDTSLLLYYAGIHTVADWVAHFQKHGAIESTDQAFREFWSENVQPHEMEQLVSLAPGN